MTRVLYLSPSRFPTVRAHGRQTAEMCAAFAACGARVVLAHPDLPPRGPIAAGVDLFDYYGLPRTFEERPLAAPALSEVFGPEPDFDSRLWRLLAHGSAAVSALGRLLREPRTGPSLLYCREKYAAFLAAELPRSRRPGILLEVHDLWRPLTRANRRLLRRVDGIVVIHPALRDDLVAEGLPPDTILVEPDGVRDVPASPPERDEARDRLGLAATDRLAVYTGHLYESKGVDVLVRAAARIPKTTVLIVGGTSEDRAGLVALSGEVGAANVRFVDHVPPAVAADYQAAADVLVVPTRPIGDNATRYTSPLKLAEYRAAGRPIVASDVPSLRAWLTHDETAWLVPPDDPAALAEGIRRLLDDVDRARRLAERARAGLGEETWNARAARILAFAAERGALSR